MRVVNKKAQAMSTNTIILLILGLIILVALIYGFYTGWGAFQASVGKTNVDSVVEQCKTSCTLNEKFGYCSNDVELRVQEEELKLVTSCGVLSVVPEFKRYGVAPCAKIQCSVPCESIRVNELTGVVADAMTEGYYDVSAFASGLADGKYCLIPRA